MLSGACRERTFAGLPLREIPPGGNLALVLASRVTGEAVSTNATLVGIAVLSPVTDLTLSGATYDTRADADPFFTRPQVAELVHSYLGSADAKHPLASPLYGQLAGMPPVRIHVGDDEVLFGDSLRYAERAVAAGVDARVDVWMGMPHGFPAKHRKAEGGSTSAGCHRCFPYRQAAGAGEPVMLPLEITAKVAGNSILVVGGACPQTRSKLTQVWGRRKSRRVLFALFLRRVSSLEKYWKADMKIGVSGASGHLGRAVVSKLLQRADWHEVVAITRTPETVSRPAQGGFGTTICPRALRRPMRVSIACSSSRPSIRNP